MPIYEFRCDDCKAQFEVIQSLSESPSDVVCEKCGSKRTKKTISASSYRLSSGKSSIPTGALSGCSSKSGFS